MKIASFEKFTLVDYPGKIASTVFTVGCNFCCPFCHNPELVINTGNIRIKSTIEDVFFDFLKRRKGKLDAVCITGGEPTLQSDLNSFIKKVKKLGYLVKLDTNGGRPEALREILESGNVDYVAMDIKSSPSGYEKAIGTKIDLDKVNKSINIIKDEKVDQEFRTTVVPGIHEYDDFVEIAKWIEGSERYALQRFRDVKIIDPKLSASSNNVLDLKKIKEAIEGHFGEVIIRG